MSYLGNPINGGVVALVVIAVVGTVGVSLFYQQQVQKMDSKTDQLSNTNQELRQNLSSARENAGEKEEKIHRLNDELRTAKKDIDQLSKQVKQDPEVADDPEPTVGEQSDGTGGIVTLGAPDDTESVSTPTPTPEETDATRTPEEVDDACGSETVSKWDRAFQDLAENSTPAEGEC